LIRPLSPNRYQITFTTDGHTRELLETARDLLRHSIPTGDAAQIFMRALGLLVKDLLKKKFGIAQDATTDARHRYAESKKDRELKIDVGRKSHPQPEANQEPESDQEPESTHELESNQQLESDPESKGDPEPKILHHRRAGAHRDAGRGAIQSPRGGRVHPDAFRSGTTVVTSPLRQGATISTPPVRSGTTVSMAARTERLALPQSARIDFSP